MKMLRDPAFLPASILTGVAVMFLVLVAVLPPMQVFALVGGTAVAVALTVARLRREDIATASKARVSVHR